MNSDTVRGLIVVCISTLLASTVFSMPSQAADKMTLVGTTSVKDSMRGQWLTLVFTEVFRRLGYELQYDGYPAGRASMMSDTGEVDGEISRVFEYQEAHPNLIRVEEVLYATKFVAFAAKPGIALHGWKSLQNTTYNVEYRIGVQLCSNELIQAVAPEHLSSVVKAEQGLKKLILGRTDLYVDVDFTIIEAIKSLNRADFDVSVLYQVGIMQEVNAYSYLHKKHAVLVPKVAEAIKNMKQEGLFEQYLEIVSKHP